MKKLPLSRRLLLGAAVALVSFACQSKQSTPPPAPPPTEAEDDLDEGDTCDDGMCEEEEQSQAPQMQPAATPVETPAAQAPVAPAVPAAPKAAVEPAQAPTVSTPLSAQEAPRELDSQVAQAEAPVAEPSAAQ
jgi:hypothetical protein